MKKELDQKQVKAIQEKLKNMSPDELKKLVKQQCLFCQISSGKVESRKIYEDDELLAILDINPASKGHTIVLPKEHYQILAQIPEDLASKLFNVANKLAAILFDVVKAGGTNIFIANGPAAGQKSPHAVIHIIPRHEGDGVGLAWEPKQGDGKVLDELQELIKDKTTNLNVKKEQPKVVEKKIVEEEEDVEERLP